MARLQDLAARRRPPERPLSERAGGVFAGGGEVFDLVAEIDEPGATGGRIGEIDG